MSTPVIPDGSFPKNTVYINLCCGRNYLRIGADGHGDPYINVCENTGAGGDFYPLNSAMIDEVIAALTKMRDHARTVESDRATP